ncbi:MAG TPA: response regulator, partial [Puia sp.]|nr:response regulator [Puia sp.]
MNKKVLIVEDQFVEANDIQLMLKKAGYTVCGIARSVPIAQEMIKKEQPGLVLLDIFLKGKLTGIDLARQLREDNIAFIYLSANSNEEILSLAKATEPYGFIVKPFREKDLLITLEIAQYLHEHSRESKYRREAELLQQLKKIMSDKTDPTQKLLQTGKIIQQDIPFDLMTAGFDNPGRSPFGGTSFLRLGFNEYQIIGLKELLIIAGISMDEFIKIHAASGKEPMAAFYNKEAFEEITRKTSLKKLISGTFHMESVLVFPLKLANGETFSFYFYSRRPDAYSPEHITMLHHLQETLTGIIERMREPEKTISHDTS